MTMLVLSITVVCLLIPVYVYVGYPMTLWILTRGRREGSHRTEQIEPSVTLVISCYNEASVIKDKVQNALALDYPREKLAILVVSDGSEDGTDEIVAGFSEQGVRLIRQEGRKGKTMGLNLAMALVASDVVVFSDANAFYAPDAIRKLVRNFADKQVGYVVGAALYTDSQKGASAFNESLYWRYELAIKAMESRLHSVVGGDGAIYAIRASLWEPLHEKDINDFVNPLQIIARGYRGVFEPEARCYEETAGNFDREIERKERIVNRSIRGLLRVKAVMNPFISGIFAWEVVSHKLLRWLIPIFLILGVTGSAILGLLGFWLFQAVTLGTVIVLGLALAGHLQRDKQKLSVWLSVPYYFVMVNLYAVRGITRALRGDTQVTWNSARTEREQR